MTSVLVARTSSGISVGTRPAHPEQTAMIEARGALLMWNVLSSSPYPAAEIHDTSAAADWLGEIYGSDAATEILATPEGDPGREVSLREDIGSSSDAASRLAHLNWAAAWWPASDAAGVPPLSRALLNAETAVLTEACEHVLDDEDAVHRALSVAAGSVSALRELSTDTVLEAPARDLLERVLDLAETFGVELQDPSAAETNPVLQENLALAAGGDRAGASDLVVQRGTASLDWHDFPAGTVDAAAEASWTISRRGDTTVLDVSVLAAPTVTFPLPEPVPAMSLLAHFAAGGETWWCELTPNGAGSYQGMVPLPVSVLLIAPEKRMLRVVCAEFARVSASETSTNLSTLRAQLVSEARGRLSAASASLAERAAARSDDTRPA